jgi:hypothetical protein
MDAIEKIRNDLGKKIIDDKRHWRILTIGRSINGSTDIVSCLVRSLRNIGHKVLHIDPKDHRGLLDNPYRLKGGMGPIWISREMLAPAIKAYKPQMIVVLAGGMSFTPEDAAILREQGIVLVGITLSDPTSLMGLSPSLRISTFIRRMHCTHTTSIKSKASTTHFLWGSELIADLLHNKSACLNNFKQMSFVWVTQRRGQNAMA